MGGRRACVLTERSQRAVEGRGGVGGPVLVGLDGCEVRLRGPCALVRPRVPCVSRVCPGSPRCLFAGLG